jgi:DNA invertase Pin-like site-specific DNA recombinase
LTALYLLVPPDPAKAKGLIAELEAYARSKGYKVVARYYERDRRLRPRLRRLRASARRGAFDMICCVRVRDLASTSAGVAQLVVELGLSAESVAGFRLDPSDPTTRWLATERQVHAARIKRALDTKRRRGESIGELPWGYRLSADGIHEEPDDHEQAAVQLALSLSRQGLGDRAVARALTDAGYRSRAETPIRHVQVARWRRRAGGSGRR